MLVLDTLLQHSSQHLLNKRFNNISENYSAKGFNSGALKQLKEFDCKRCVDDETFIFMGINKIINCLGFFLEGA